MCSWHGTAQNSFKLVTALIVQWVKLKPTAVLRSISQSPQRDRKQERNSHSRAQTQLRAAVHSAAISPEHCIGNEKHKNNSHNCISRKPHSASFTEDSYAS